MPMQVPGLIPDVQPQVDATPNVSIPTPVEAFGGAVGHALSGLGAQVERSGDQIWERAVQFQDLKNRSEVDKGDAEYMKQAGLLHANFSALQGDQAQAAFPKYIQDLQNARENIRKGLSNSAVQRMYDSQTLSTMGRTIFNGAGHAATQTKLAAIDAIQSRIQAQVDVAGTSNNPEQIADARKKIGALNTTLHGLKGTTDQASIDNDELVINSSLSANVLKNKADKDPWAAEEDMEALRKEGKLTGKDYSNLQTYILAHKRGIGATNIATEVMKGATDEDGNIIKSQDALEKEVKGKAGDDPVLAQHATAQLHTLMNQKKYGDRQFKAQNMDTVNIALQNGASTEQELRADPKVASAMDNVPMQNRKGGWSAYINSYVAARDKAFNERSMTAIAGLRNSDQESFLDLDPTDPKYKLNQTQIRTVWAQQQQDKRHPRDDAQVMRAMSWLRGSVGAQMNALGVYSMPPSSKGEDARDDYLHFVGALSSSMDSWKENHGGKNPGSKEVIDEIFPSLLATHSQPKWFGLSSDNVPFFKQEVPADFSQRYKNEVSATANDEEIYRNYIQFLLMKREKDKVPDAARGK